MKHRPLVLIVLLTAFTLPGFAAERVLLLSPDETQVNFRLEATGHDVEGHLFLQTGEVTFDPATGAASGEIRIDAVRSETGNAKRDKTMHKKVLLTQQFPSIVFEPERLEGVIAAEGTSEVDLVGTVSLAGSDHPLTLPTKVEVAGGRLSAETTFTVPYVEWGLEDPSILFLRVAKEVQVSIAASGTFERSAAMTAGAPAGER